MQVKLIFSILAISLLLNGGCENNINAQQASAEHQTTNEKSLTLDPPVYESESWQLFEQRAGGKRFYGDFNGDGRLDTLMMVSVSEIGPLTAEAVLHSAWPYYGEQSVSPDLSHGGPIALVVGENLLDRFQLHIIYDPNPVSVLSTQAAEGIFIVSSADWQNPAWQEVDGEAKGDLVVIPTEAGIDSYLFWDGNAYRSLQVIEMP